MYLLLFICITAAVVWIWFEIYINIGFTPSVKEYCDYFPCSFPKDYDINTFGKIWSWSPIWLPLLVILFFALKSKNYRKKTMLFLIIISLFGSIVWILPNILPQQTFNSEIQSWGNSLSHEKYITQYQIGGNEFNTLHLTLSDKFNELSIQEKYDFMEKKIWTSFSDQRQTLFFKYRSYSDPDKSTAVVTATSSMGSYQASNGTFVDKDGKIYELDVLSGVLKKGKTEEELKQESIEYENNRKIRIHNSEPTKGMFESDLHDTKWGEPTKIEKSEEYDIKRVGYRYIVYTWEAKDGTGFIYEIRDAYVEEGIVTSTHVNKYTKRKK